MACSHDGLMLALEAATECTDRVRFTVGELPVYPGNRHIVQTFPTLTTHRCPFRYGERCGRRNAFTCTINRYIVHVHSTGKMGKCRRCAQPPFQTTWMQKSSRLQSAAPAVHELCSPVTVNSPRPVVVKFFVSPSIERLRQIGDDPSNNVPP